MPSTAAFACCSSFSAAMYSLGHGGNDAQKTMGIIAVLLYSQGMLGGEFHVPFWVVITCQAAMGLGTLVRRLAHRAHDGIAHHPAQAGPGLLRGDRRGDHAVPGDRSRRAGVDDAHDHRRHRRRRRRAPQAAVRWSVASASLSPGFLRFRPRRSSVRRRMRWRCCSELSSPSAVALQSTYRSLGSPLLDPAAKAAW